MTQEEKAKRYDEALEKARQIHNADRVSGIELTTCEEIFPELKESEDERIKEQVVYAINQLHVCECTKNKLLAWIEEQCEHANFRDSIQVGDKVTKNEDGVLVNLSQLKRVAKKDEQILANSAKTCKDEQKPEWSEEDENVLEDIEEAIINYWHGDTQDILLDRLKSLRPPYYCDNCKLKNLSKDGSRVMSRWKHFIPLFILKNLVIMAD